MAADSCQRLAKLGLELVEWAFDPAGPSDQDMVGPSDSGVRENPPRKLAEAALHAIADHRIANLLGHGKAKANRGITIVARSYQKDETRRRRASAAVRGKEFRAARKLDDKARS